MNRLSRFCDGLMEAAWLLVFITVPLFFNLESARPFAISKVILFRSICWVGLAAWLIKIISEKGLHFYSIDQPITLKKVIQFPLVLPVLLLAISYLVSTLFSLTPWVSLVGSFERTDGLISRWTYLLFFFMILANLRRRGQVERILSAFVLVSFPIALYAILQHFHLDPIGWKNVDVDRSLSTLGHPIFAAAFMTFCLFISLGRLFMIIAELRPTRLEKVIRLALYLLVIGLNLVAILFTVSRGPLLGLMAGLLFYALGMLAYHRLRKLSLVALGLAIPVLSFIVLLNLPSGPLSGWRDSAWVGPLGHLLDKQAGTGLQRSIVWEGMSRLVTPHAALRSPNNTRDHFNLLRPLFGYGPENIQYAYEGFYNPKTYIIEARNLIFDRSHNEFWDALVSYGLLGFIAEYGFFLTVFYFALKWLGMIHSRRERNLYWILSLAGGAIGGLVMALAMGPGFLGLGVPVGLLVGPAGILLLNLMRKDSQKDKPLPTWHSTLVIGLFAAIAAHYVEILFGISMDTSLIPLWTFTALLVVVGYIIPKSSVPEQRPSSLLPTVAINLLLLAAFSATLTMDFIASLNINESTYSQILNGSLTTLAGITGAASLAPLVLLLASLVYGVLQLHFDQSDRWHWKNSALMLLFTLAVTLFICILSWMLRAAHLAAYLKVSSTPMPAYASALGWVLYAYLLGLLVIGLLTAWVLSSQLAALPGPDRNPVALAAYVILPVLTFVSIFQANLKPAQADMLFALASTQSSNQHYQASLDTLQYAIKLNPRQDYYQGSAAMISLEYSWKATDVLLQRNLAKQSLDHAQQAASLAPWFVDYVIDQAQAYQRLGYLGATFQEQKNNFDLASLIYSNAVAVKPSRVDFWASWAELLTTMGNYPAAIDKIETAISIDSEYELLYASAGSIYGEAADRQTDPIQKTRYLEKALAAFQTEVDLEKSKGLNTAPALVNVAMTLDLLSRTAEACQTLLLVADLGLGADQWQVYVELASLSGKLNDQASQKAYLQQAIRLAPADQLATLQAELDRLGK